MSYIFIYHLSYSLNLSSKQNEGDAVKSVPRQVYIIWIIKEGAVLS